MVRMDEGQKKRIEEIMAEMECEKGFQCCKDGFGNICNAEDRGLPGYVECLEENPGTCKFRLPFGYGVMCRCKVRVYVAKELRI